MYIEQLKTEIGYLHVYASDVAIEKVEFNDKDIEVKPNAVSQQCIAQLREYFSGTRRRFDLPLSANGTEFQQKVWRALCDVPFGKTESYRDVAERISQPTASRAVGTANGRNPIAIIIPCHRIIGANGTLTGYAGGVDRKAWLLKHEGAHFIDDLFD